MLRWLVLLALACSIWALDPVTIGVGLSSISAGVYYNSALQAKLGIKESCHGPKGTWIGTNWIQHKPDLSDLPAHIFGQHIAVEIVRRLVSRHLADPKPDKPLVLSFHGFTGVGKNHLSKLIAQRIYPQYRDSGSSKFVHWYVSTHLISASNKADPVEEVRAALKACPRSLFVLDEVDKFPEGYLDQFLPFFDHNTAYPEAIFLLLGNAGGERINREVKQLLDSGVPREQIKYQDLESILSSEAIRKGGLKGSQLINRAVIDSFVPFLPLEQRHVEMCIADHLKRKHGFKKPESAPGRKFIQKIIQQIEFYDSRFSKFGCKRVSSKVDMNLPEQNEL